MQNKIALMVEGFVLHFMLDNQDKIETTLGYKKSKPFIEHVILKTQSTSDTSALFEQLHEVLYNISKGII